MAFSQEITYPIGSIYIAETPVIAYKLSRDNLELLPTSFLIDKSYKIKIYSEFKHNNTRYYIIKVLNYFYGNDYIIKSYLPEKPLVATVKTDMPKMRVANVTLEELIADTSGSKFNITSIINNNEPVHICENLNCKLPFKKVKRQKYCSNACKQEAFRIRKDPEKYGFNKEQVQP